MSYSLLSQSGQRSGRAYGVQSFVLDTPEDFQDLPTSIPMGCSAFVISTKKRYMYNGNQEWHAIGSASSGGGSGSGEGSGEVYDAIPFDVIDAMFDSREGQ